MTKEMLGNELRLSALINQDKEKFKDILEENIEEFRYTQATKKKIDEVHDFLYVVKDLSIDFFEVTSSDTDRLDDLKIGLYKVINGLVDGILGEQIDFALKTRFFFDVYIRILYEYVHAEPFDQHASFSKRIDQITKKLKNELSDDAETFLVNLRDDTKRQYWSLSDDVHGNMKNDVDKHLADDLESVFEKSVFVESSLMDCLGRLIKVLQCVVNYLIAVVEYISPVKLSSYKIDIYNGVLKRKWNFELLNTELYKSTLGEV